jgi:hypothetical protein
MELGYVRVPALLTSFHDLRQSRFRQGARRYDEELRARFGNLQDTTVTSSTKRYEDVGFSRDVSGHALASFETLVRRGLIEEHAANGQEWVAFDYTGQRARSNFAPLVFAAQDIWFVPISRCLKYRIIHDYDIEGEDLQVKAAANKSCQCAEDIVYAKLGQLGRVGNVDVVTL